MSDVPEDKGAATLAKTALGTIRAFCQNETLLNTICMSVIFTVFDGAPYAQLSGLILCREHFKNALGSKKNSFHDFMKLCEEAAKKDSTWGPIRYELLTKKHAIIKDLHYAQTVKLDWLQWQTTILDDEGHQGGSGRQRVRDIIRYMPYGPTRAAVEADCLEVICRTMKATMCTMASRVSKGSTTEIQQAYKSTLDTMKTAEWLRVGLNADKKIVERATLRRFDNEWSCLPMKKKHI